MTAHKLHVFARIPLCTCFDAKFVSFANMSSENCYNCHQNVGHEMKKCFVCYHALYCSEACRIQHWNKHERNCVVSRSSLHDMFDACRMQMFPIPSAACDYGFDNMDLFHKNLVSREGFSAKIILLGLYQLICEDINKSEERGDGGFTWNSIGASKTMIVEAYENNALDEFIHRYISSVIEKVGKARIPPICSIWLQNKLVIGPTRLLLSETVSLTGQQIANMRNEISLKYYGPQ